MEQYAHYSLLAELFRYPRPGYQDKVADCAHFLAANYPEAAQTFARFADFMARKQLYEVEEIFGKTFHIQAICFLDIGYVLFGEDYKRGDFLVNMKEEQAKAKNDCGEELPDNLPNVLKLLSLLQDEEFTTEMAVRVLQPALVKMLREFESSRMQMREKVLRRKHKALLLQGLEGGNIYLNALQMLLEVLEADFYGIQFNDPLLRPTIGGLPNCTSGCGPNPQNADFLNPKKKIQS